MKITMENEVTKYTAKELLEIFKEQQRLCVPLDDMAYQIELTENTSIWEWRDAQDLLPWEELSKFLNQEFRINASKSEWKEVLTPEDDRTLRDLCSFIANKAEKIVFKPVKRLGTESLTAAIFLTIKMNLKKKGVDTSELRPSTSIEQFLEVDDNFSPLIEEVTLTGGRVFDKIEFGELETERRFKHWVDKIFPHIIYKRPLKTGSIETFRDLVETIASNVKRA